jgi:hypothetical protein
MRFENCAGTLKQAFEFTVGDDCFNSSRLFPEGHDPSYPLLQPQEIALRGRLDLVPRGVKNSEGKIAREFLDRAIHGLSCSEKVHSLVSNRRHCDISSHHECLLTARRAGVSARNSALRCDNVCTAVPRARFLGRELPRTAYAGGRGQAGLPFAVSLQPIVRAGFWRDPARICDSPAH